MQEENHEIWITVMLELRTIDTAEINAVLSFP